jgi:hypothetical protein
MTLSSFVSTDSTIGLNLLDRGECEVCGDPAECRGTAANVRSGLR